jgi:hypothetical protein
MDSRHQSQKLGRKQGQIAVGSLPLLDDVNELIEKEKILLEFKVLEQQKEAFEWKAKYDHLLVKVAENASSTGNDGDYRVLEAITEDISAVDNVRINSNLIDYIHKLGDHYILDISGKSAEFVVSQITTGAHILKQYASLLQAVYLRGCCLTDDNAQMLCTKFVSNSAITGTVL